MNARPSLVVRDLCVEVRTRHGIGKAVDGASFELRRGETLGLVGESGSGKSMTALAILGLQPRPAATITGGEIIFEGEDLTKTSAAKLRSFRGRRIAMILQDPMTALNPVFTVGKQIKEPLKLHQHLRGDQLNFKAIETLRLLRIPSPDERLGSYPHQLSGGMRQRVVGAIALSCAPEILIADEPTTSLDVTIQASLLALLQDIQRMHQLGILFITHDFAVVSRMCDRVAVMYAGRIVETAPARELFERPAHPYTEALMKSVPALDARTEHLPSIRGSPPSIYEKMPGCAFAPRCPYVMQRCRQEAPPLTTVGESHEVRCWLRM